MRGWCRRTAAVAAVPLAATLLVTRLPGWGNPYQPGTLTVISATQAVFTDKAGHHVVFTPASSGPGRATARVCS